MSKCLNLRCKIMMKLAETEGVEPSSSVWLGVRRGVKGLILLNYCFAAIVILTLKYPTLTL